MTYMPPNVTLAGRLMGVNVLHVSSHDKGGAGNVALTLTREFDARPGSNARLLVGNKRTEFDSVTEFHKLPFDHELNYVVERILSLDGLAGPGSLDFRRRVESFGADVVHLHNLHAQYFNILNLLRIPRDVPVVWTFHDMWPITGNCVYAYGCDRYRDTCGSCPQLDEYPSLKFDTTPYLLRLKDALFRRRPVTAISPSRWLLEAAQESRMEFADLVHIPNGVDTEHFRPHDVHDCRDEFGISKTDQVILFLAHSLGDHRKGIDLLFESLKTLPDKSNTTLLVVGSGEIDTAELPSEYSVIQPGHISDEMLPLAYSAADLFAIPSRADNCPLVVLEAMACGTPVVGFPAGGIPELISNQTGWLAPSIDAEAFARTLATALASSEELGSKGIAARQRACSEYSLGEFVNRHEKLYAEITSNYAN